ncbi:ABC-type transport auxiliary lipoprotein family protein [Enterovirga aerilata]|uniref:ABC transporter n=1 Tax=Enterovirga aerilata TaxID=2730920 RepID=A0A849I670_9HYPH|nr:ABC-type transport auxiliary lipoprotein family protein [Enterovirga sp. DB1703]NNM71899.1 ABC transporter [Enterovirga sp. DB1703]
MPDQPTIPGHRPGLASAGLSAARAAAGALMLGLAACGSAPSTAFDLSAARGAARSGRIAGQLIVAEPTTVQAFEAERIVAKDQAGTVSLLGGGQWADRLPRLVQSRLIETLEGASRTRAVGRPGDGITGDNQLNTEIRAFNFDARTGEAVVEISAKLVDIRSGRVLNGRVFTARTPVGSANVAEVAPALDRSAGTVFASIARWLASGPQSLPQDPSLRVGSL